MNKKPSPGKRLIYSLRTLRDALQGEKSGKFKARTVVMALTPPEFGPEDVKRVREELRASQGVFAKLLGVSIKTVQAWEQGNSPPPMARRLLDSIQQDPKPWQKMLREAAEVT